jgi:hypothetical protein
MSREDQSGYQRKAENAMRMAIAAHGSERLIWVRMALLWQGLGRDDSRHREQHKDAGRPKVTLERV